MAMLLCSSRSARQPSNPRCRLVDRASGRRLAAPVILGVSANFRQFPPARSLRLYPFDLLAFWGFRHFRHFRRRFLEVPLSKAVLGARKGRRKAGWVGVCRPAMGLALEADKQDVGLRSDAQLVKYQFRKSQAIL
jgi:hypothetical protein